MKRLFTNKISNQLKKSIKILWIFLYLGYQTLTLMKKLTSLALSGAFVFLSVLHANSQQTVFMENIGETSVGTSEPTARTYTGFQNYGVRDIQIEAPTGSTTRIKDNSSTSSGYPSASGGNYVNISGNSASYLRINQIYIRGATNIKLAFGVRKARTMEDGSSLIVNVTVDGNTVTFSPILPSGSGTTGWYYFQSTITIPTGSAMNIEFLNSSVNPNSGSFGIDDIVLISDTPLPINFGEIQAVQQHGEMNIGWTTFKETNNDYFEVQLSRNGVRFETIKTVQSKNGNSEMPQHYDTTISMSGTTILLGIPFLVILLFFSWRRKSWPSFLLAVMVISSVGTASCTKGEAGLQETENSQLFIRIKQVDKDGSQTYSKVVKVINR
ncbi:hypothetical protein [Niabella ginsengisoli]|uniref:CBM6 domain-containing protein n=1 Tax=Niabella ginsengisoli TaxID=522298 RepID=A0ABS9SQK1_9BACT|nr:hypothetical protein [Niabella ginsengisoli]MCH5600632.1 hypothetical protein [Niabella ginsengisoli]